jgi:D-aminopeptidase
MFRRSLNTTTLVETISRFHDRMKKRLIPRFSLAGVCLRPLSTITDVPAPNDVSLVEGDLRTGVTAVLPHGRDLYAEKVTAASAVLNGYGKSVGLMQIDELGTIETPILVTSTLNVPRVADALISYALTSDEQLGVVGTVNPVVLECFDGYLSDARARAVGEAEVFEAIRSAKEGPVEEGCVGAGVGMRCQGFKSGVGTSSRVTEQGATLGVLVVPNFGRQTVVAGGVGHDSRPRPAARAGSCIFVVAADAPFPPSTCDESAGDASWAWRALGRSAAR